MVQVLPYVPSFGEKLLPILQESGGKIAEAFEKRNARTALEKIYQSQQPQANQPGGAQNVSQQGQQPQAINPIQAIKTHELAIKGYGRESANVHAKAALKQQELQEKEAQQIRKEERERTASGIQKRVESTTGQYENINSKRKSLLQAKGAVASGEVGAFSLNSFADLFGEAGQRLKSATGAQLDAATKHLLFDSLHDVTAKGTNLWLEKVAKSALPGLGKTKEANETLITLALGDLDLKQKKLELQDSLLSEYEKLGIKPPADFEKTVNELLKPYGDQLEKQMAYETRVIYEKEKGPRFLNNLEKVPEGTPLTLEKRDAIIKKTMADPKKPISEATPKEREKAKKLAEKLGYTIPTSDPTQRMPENLGGE